MQTWWISFFPILMLCIILALHRRETKQYIAARVAKQKGEPEMYKIAQRYVGKEVLLDTVSSGSYDGVIREVVDNAVVLDKNGRQTVVNLDYVIRLREYPRNKRGKKKAVIAD